MAQARVAPHYLVMAGLDPAIHVLATEKKGVDARVLVKVARVGRLRRHVTPKAHEGEQH